MNLDKVKLDVTLEVGRTKASLGEIEKLSEGDVIQLDSLIGDKLDIRVNGVVVARGEVVIVGGENYGVKITEVLNK